MSTSPAPQTTSPQKQRLSSQQMLHLMRLEMDRALRHGYPISCMVTGLDAFDQDEHLEHRRRIMPLLFQELKAVTFENDVRGLGIWTEEFVLAVFPHVDPEKLESLAASMLEKARAMEVEDLPEGLTPTFSIGISHNLHPGQSTFETVVEEAETGMGIAREAGGDRVVQAKEIIREMDLLREEVQHQIEELHEVQKKLFGLDNDDGLWGKQLIDKVIDLFERAGDKSEAVLRMEKEVIALLHVELAAWKETSSASQAIDALREVERLERRVEKLTESLGLTEAELKRVAAMKNIDLGVSSIYRTVQGLDLGAEGASQKKEMLKNIFEANLALREATK